jgi:hypothetical protein
LRPAAFILARKIVFIGALACFASLACAHAADPKPDASVKNKAVEANVFLDDKIKADTALAADCLAEGKQWIDKTTRNGRSEGSVMKRTLRRFTVRTVVDQTGRAWHFLGSILPGRERFAGINR